MGAAGLTDPKLDAIKHLKGRVQKEDAGYSEPIL